LGSIPPDDAVNGCRVEVICAVGLCGAKTDGPFFAFRLLLEDQRQDRRGILPYILTQVIWRSLCPVQQSADFVFLGFKGTQIGVELVECELFTTDALKHGSPSKMHTPCPSKMDTPSFPAHSIPGPGCLERRGQRQLVCKSKKKKSV
jgi:hypothetical protein